MKRNSESIRARRLLALAVGVLFYSGGNTVRPDLRPLGPSIADRGSAYYHFTRRQYDSANGEHHYRVRTAVPDKTPPAAGYPMLYMLDGNTMTDKLNDALLQQLSTGSPPVIVAIGYRATLPFDTVTRAWDYIPPPKAFKPQIGEPALPPRKTGSDDPFRQLLAKTMVPQMEANLKIDSRQRVTWGHSYGGLFVFDVWRKTSLFHLYYSTSPPLNQVQESPLKGNEALSTTAFSGKSLHLLEGNDKATREPTGHVAFLSLLRHIQQQLVDKGPAVAFWHCPGMTHGQMFGVSLQSTLLHLPGQAPLAHQQ